MFSEKLYITMLMQVYLLLEIYDVEILKALEVTRIQANDITLLPELLK